MRPTTLLALGSTLVLSLLIAAPGTLLADHHRGAAPPLAKKLSEADRPDDDMARDAGRRPAEMMVFLGVAPGMTAVDLVAAGGYYTEVLSVTVGPEGRVYAQNNEYVLKIREGVNEKAISARLANDRLPNVQRLDREVSDLGLEPGSVDVAITALNFHDIYNGRGAEAAASFLANVFAILEPGGVLGIIDHVGDRDKDNKELHRIEEAKAVEAAKAVGFVVEARSQALHFADDDHTKNVFDPSIRGKTDRFALRLRKPR
jgi:predicted methyltransferase